MLESQVFGDHDLLVRIDEKLRNLKDGFEAERVAQNLKLARTDTEIEKIRLDVDSLRTTRAQFYAIAATISFGISVLVKVFWH